jgi:hypothetical protein
MAQSLGTPFAGVQTATASAVALPSQLMINGVVLKADYANAGTILIGPCATLTTANGYPLKAGEAISYGPANIVNNLSSICIIDTVTTDIIHFTGN